MFGHNYCNCYILLLYYLDLDSRSEAEQSNTHLKRPENENMQLPRETPPVLFITQFRHPAMHSKIRDADCNDDPPCK